MEPGRPLPEPLLAKEYNVARPTMRAAIQQLTYKGLLSREANKSAMVPLLAFDDFLDLFRTRRLVESEAIRIVVREQVDLTIVEQAVVRLEQIHPDARWSEVVEADLLVHRNLIAASRSPRLLRLFGSLEDEIRLAIAQLRLAYHGSSHLAQEHRELLTVIKSGAETVALQMLEEHLERAIADLTGPQSSLRSPDQRVQISAKQ